MDKDLQYQLPEDFQTKIVRYKKHLMKWNKIHNLTGARDEATLDAFIEDALYPVNFLPRVESLMDIGTGAGFPGMILALALPQTQVTLVEPLRKRASFLQFIKADLGLDNVTVVAKKVQEMPCQIFDIITSRAVTQTKMLLEFSEGFRDEHTLLLFYKGQNVYNELEDAVTGMQSKVITTQNRHYLLLGKDV